ncbi:hypothetical protein BR93DRAFT_972426 [Coniochaeta sp. PMI_546]|nr:hypothetical protein BR93DRAFT_972426 [Coniochaeta sp. PMI_546]
MSTENLDSGLLGIALSDSEDDSPKECSEPTTREERNAQSEEEFQKLKSTYRVKVENGEIWKTVQLPLGDTVSKPQAQELVHAVEELYFFRRHGEAVEFIRRVWREGGSEGGGLDSDTRELLAYYERRCEERMSEKS